MLVNINKPLFICLSSLVITSNRATTLTLCTLKKRHISFCLPKFVSTSSNIRMKQSTSSAQIPLQIGIWFSRSSSNYLVKLLRSLMTTLIISTKSIHTFHFGESFCQLFEIAFFVIICSSNEPFFSVWTTGARICKNMILPISSSSNQWEYWMAQK